MYTKRLVSNGNIMGYIIVDDRDYLVEMKVITQEEQGLLESKVVESVNCVKFMGRLLTEEEVNGGLVQKTIDITNNEDVLGAIRGKLAG